MKKILFVLSLVLLLTVTGYSYAQTAATNSATGGTTRNSLKLQVDADKIQDLKTRADREIQRRLDALNRLLTKVGAVKKLTPAELSVLQTQVQSEITSLNTLKAKIDADTDLTTLRTDIQSIITNYRVFAFFIVDINLTTAADRMTNTLDKMTIVFNKLQVRIGEAKAKNQDVTKLNNLLLDMNANLNNAKTTLDAVKTELAGLNVQGYPGNKSILLDAREKLKTAYSYLRTAHKDAKEVILGLNSLKQELKEKPSSNSAVKQNP